MIIDMHAHIGDLRSPSNLESTPVTVENLITRLDEEGIDKAVVLPWPACPEAVKLVGLFSPQAHIVSQVRAACSRPDRLIPFGNADPRWGGNSSHTDFSWMLEKFVEMGCVGMGEVSANIYFDDPRVVNLFHQCGRWNLPVTIESTGPGEGKYEFIDEVGSPHLERLLQKVPGTVIVGHGPGFWAEIASGLTNKEKAGYPTGPIVKEGSLSRLFRTYHNLYADLSARSGFNAITRDKAYGISFLNEFQDRLMFGTDVIFADREGQAPHLEYLQGQAPHLKYLQRLLTERQISQGVFEKIAYKNALSIMKRYKH